MFSNFAVSLLTKKNDEMKIKIGQKVTTRGKPSTFDEVVLFGKTFKVSRPPPPHSWEKFHLLFD